MTIEQIDSKLKELSTTCSVDQAKALVDALVTLLGINETKKKELLTHRSIDREVTRFVSAPMLRNQAAAYNIPHESDEPIDLKLFWVKNTTKANLSWLVALTPNYEDDPVNNENANLGIDFVLSESCDRLYIILSYKLKLRVLELHETLSHTQKEILENWIKIRRELDPTSGTYKEQLRAHLWKSFDFEPVNKLFYNKLIEQFDHLVAHLKENIPEEEAKMFTVKLFGRTLFLWFLKKKEFLNPKINYFRVSGEDDQTKYYRDFLEPLFFEVLNSEIRGRQYPDEITPFLNGGLFEPVDTDFYKDSVLTFPEGFFTQFYALLNKFNFTVDEGTSDYEQVAVDPEMLGRVFENLLASINPETETSARKAKGAFYTPRTIVDYMCEQSLIEYLKTQIPESPVRDQRIEEMVTMKESDFREQDHNKRRDWKRDLGKESVIRALDELKVLDPAVGSGAFPMGMLQLLVKVYSRIETTNEKDLAGLKRRILSRSLYGVDIDQMAIQISRLRAWLSILVDMQDLRRVQPLPNLDFKFVCANTLIPLAEGIQDNLFDEHQLKEDLIGIRDKYYEATKKADKKKLREQYLEKIRDGGLFAELESERLRQLKDYNPFNSLNSSGFYDPSLMHGVEKFEIAIGNPPYFVYEGCSTNEIATLKNISRYKKAEGGKMNAFKLFLAATPDFLTEKGITSMIFQNSFLGDNSAKNIRKHYLLEERILQIDSFPERDDSKKRVFEGVKMSVCILLAIKNKNENYNFNLRVWEDRDKLKGFATTFKINDLHYIDPESYVIPMIKENEKQIIRTFFGGNQKIGDIFQCYQGEINMSTHKNLLTGDDSLPEVIKGAKVQRYHLVDKMSQGEIEFIDEKNYLKKNKGPKSKHHLVQRIVMQGITGVDETLRIKATLVQKGKYCAHSCNYILPNDNYDTYLLLGILNSSILNFVFKKSSTNSNVNSYEIENMPIPKISKENISYANKISSAVQSVLQIKKLDNKKDTSDLEHQINELVLGLYSFSEGEKEIISSS